MTIIVDHIKCFLRLERVLTLVFVFLFLAFQVDDAFSEDLPIGAGPSVVTAHGGSVETTGVGSSWEDEEKAVNGYTNSSATTLLDVSGNANDYSQLLNINDFGFNIPSTATIDGITLTITKKAQNKISAVDNVLRLTKLGTLVGDDKSKTTPWPGNRTGVVYGGTSDLWGTTWSYSDLANIGVQFGVLNEANKSGEASVSDFELSVSYTIVDTLEYLTSAQTGLDYVVYLIKSPADLICLSTSPLYWDKVICQVEDIDFDVDDDGDFEGGTGGWGSAGERSIPEGDWNMNGVVDKTDNDTSDTKGFFRIGSAANYFTGTYQGASWDETDLKFGVDRSIKNLFINRDDIWGDGLFAKTKNADIKNVHLIDVNISSKGQAGALIGYAISNTNVEDCSSSGRVYVSGREAGGLIGYSSGVVIERSFSSCTVISSTTNQLNIGGLVGKLDWSGEITNCSASGDVYAQSAGNVGGLVGLVVSANVEESYATGFVHGGTSVGGFIGYSNKSTVSNSYSAGAIMAESVAGSFIGSADESNGTSLLEFCYATGNVALSGAITSLGAFVGYDSGTTYNDCYYDNETTGAADSLLNDLSSGDDANITALSTSDFAISTNFNFSSSKWNFDNRPYLDWQNDVNGDYNVSNPIPEPIVGGFRQEATCVGTVPSVKGLRYAKIKPLDSVNIMPLAYDDFSNHAYGWDDGSSTKTWTAGGSYSGFGITSGTDMEYTHSSGISVLGGDDYLKAYETNGYPTDESKYVSRELEGLDETFYVSFLARFSSTVSGSWSFIALGKKDGFDDSGAALGTLFSGSKIGAAFANDGYSTEDVATMGSSSPVGGHTYFVVGKWTCNASGNITKIDTWINPTSPNVEDAVYHTSIDVVDGIPDQMSAIDIQSYYSNTSYIDEIRVGRTWSSVVPCEMHWFDVPATSVSGNTFTTEQTDLDNGVYCVQPYIVKTDGSREYGDMSCVKVDDINIDRVTMITDTSAILYGYITKGSSIKECGFYYSADNDKTKLINGGTHSSVIAYSGVAIEPIHSNYSCHITGLMNRSAYYFRSYMKDASNNYTYGKVVRFISEKRDFSLALDGDGDFLLIDSTTTHDVINDWGADENTFSVDFWMRNASTDTFKMALVSDTCHSGTNSMGYLIAFSHGQFYFESGGYMNKTDSVVFDQEWHHVACTYNAKDVRIYVDESLIPSVYSSFTLTRPTVDVNCLIGCTNDLKEFTKFCYFNGNIDAMRFWNVALTADQISELCYDNVKSNPSSNTITCIASGRAIPGLTADNLTASLGFNVMSTQESVGNIPVDSYYPSQDGLHALPFFHTDPRLQSDSTSFNIVAVGDAHPSPYLPRVHWRCNPTDSVWMDSSNWGGFAYPGQGVFTTAYPDVSASNLANDSAYCLYTIVDSSAIRPVVTDIPPEVQILVDKEGRIGTYRVDESASKLTILKGIYPRMFDAADIDSKDGAIDIEEGSMEVFQ